LCVASAAEERNDTNPPDFEQFSSQHFSSLKKSRASVSKTHRSRAPHTRATGGFVGHDPCRSRVLPEPLRPLRAARHMIESIALAIEAIT
jgi:hypothetical protein